MKIFNMGERIFRVKTSWANNGCHGLVRGLMRAAKATQYCRTKTHRGKG